MTVSGSLSVAGSSALLMLKPNESALITLSVSATQFEGTVRVEDSANQQQWNQAVDVDGVSLTYTYANGAEKTTGTIVAATVKNTTRARRFYRVTAPVVVEDPVVYSMVEASDDVIAVVLRDHLNRPMFGVREDGSIAALVKLWATNGLAASDGDLQVADITISAADIVSTSANKLGHAQGYPLVANPGADVGLEFVDAVLVCDFATHAYGNGGNLTINVNGGGAALTGLVSALNSLGAAADKVAIFRPLAAAAEVVVANKGINLVSSAAFTVDTGSAGVARIRVYYRLHTLGLA